MLDTNQVHSLKLSSPCGLPIHLHMKDVVHKEPKAVKVSAIDMRATNIQSSVKDNFNNMKASGKFPQTKEQMLCVTKKYLNKRTTIQFERIIYPLEIGLLTKKN